MWYELFAGNMLISGGMLSFYKTTPAVMLWQFINQVKLDTLYLRLYDTPREPQDMNIWNPY